MGALVLSYPANSLTVTNILEKGDVLFPINKAFHSESDVVFSLRNCFSDLEANLVLFGK